LSQFIKYHPSGNLTFNNLGIFQSFILSISMEKILPISLKLNLAPNTSGVKRFPGVAITLVVCVPGNSGHGHAGSHASGHQTSMKKTLSRLLKGLKPSHRREKDNRHADDHEPAASSSPARARTLLHSRVRTLSSRTLRSS